MRIKKRGLFLCIAAPMVATGFAIFLATKNTTARYVSLFFAMSGKRDLANGSQMKADVESNSQARLSEVPCVRLSRRSHPARCSDQQQIPLILQARVGPLSMSRVTQAELLP